MLTISQPCNTPFHIFKNTVLNWPEYKFYKRAFETDNARIIKKNDCSMLFHATTKEFGMFNTHVYGRVYIIHHYVTVEYFLKQKRLSTGTEVESLLNKQSHFFKLCYDQTLNTLLLSDPGENIYSESILKRKLNIIVQGLESITLYSETENNPIETESFSEINPESEVYTDLGDINPGSDLKTYYVNDTVNSESESSQSETGEYIDYICNDESVINAFRVLMINPTADLKKIKIAYRKLSKENHPDRITNKNMKRYASLRFGEISTAYRTLINHFNSNINLS